MRFDARAAKETEFRACTARNNMEDSFFVISTFSYLNIAMFSQHLGKSVND
jgi:hypothetical protein